MMFTERQYILFWNYGPVAPKRLKYLNSALNEGKNNLSLTQCGVEWTIYGWNTIIMSSSWSFGPNYRTYKPYAYPSFIGQCSHVPT